MRLQAFAFILFNAIALFSCNINNSKIEEPSDIRKSCEDELVNHQIYNNDGLVLNNSEIHDVNHNNIPLGSVVIINNSSNWETVVVPSGSNNISENKGHDHNELIYSDAPPSSYRKLPRHQRAITAVAEKRGFLKNADGERILRRGKRYLQFAKGSRVSVSN